MRIEQAAVYTVTPNPSGYGGYILVHRPGPVEIIGRRLVGAQWEAVCLDCSTVYDLSTSPPTLVCNKLVDHADRPVSPLRSRLPQLWIQDGDICTFDANLRVKILFHGPKT